MTDVETPVTTEDDRPARNWFRLLVDPLFGAYFFGRTLSSTGIWIYSITAAVLTFELTGSAFMVGLVSVGQFLPQVLFAALTGSLADRGNRKRQVVIGRTIVTAGSGALALWLWLATAEASVTSWVIVLSAVMVGLGFVTGGPAMHAMVPALVRKNEIGSAVTLNILPLPLARAAGPALGAWIALEASPAVAFAVAAACNFGFVLALLGMTVPQKKREPGSDSSMRGAFAHLRRDRPVAILLIGVAAIGFGSDPAVTLAPALSAEMGYGTLHTGTFASAFGVGAGLAFLVIPVLRRFVGTAASGTVGLALFPAGFLVLIIASTPWGAVPGFALAGMGMTVALTSLSAHLQQRLPDGLRGRIMALWTVGFLGSRPFAAALNGTVADLVSVTAALILLAVIMAAATWLCRPTNLDQPVPGTP